MARMVWGKGGSAERQPRAGRFPTLDFAGGTVVHITSGVSALICATYLGRRIGYPKEPIVPHSVDVLGEEFLQPRVLLHAREAE